MAERAKDYVYIHTYTQIQKLCKGMHTNMKKKKEKKGGGLLLKIHKLFTEKFNININC